MTLAQPAAFGTAMEIAAAVRSGERTAASVVEEHLSVIGQNDADIHAFNHVMADQAQAAAATVDERVAAGEDVGPMAGVPVTLKDNMCTRGVPTTCSSKILEDWHPPYSASVIDRLEASGAVMVGKANLDEFAMGSSTENSAFGPTRNPHDLNTVPGGSSGGSAAAVAAGYSPVSLGSDTGGSIRQPASFCGLVGVKPTYGAVSRYGLIAFGSSLDQIGPFATDVVDAALTYEVIAGHDPADTTSVAQPALPVSSKLAAGVDGLRVGMISEMVGGTIEGLSSDVLARTNAAAEALSNAGAVVGECSIPSCMYGLAAYYMVAPAEASSNLARFDGVRYGLREDGANTALMNTASRTAGFGAEVKRRIMLGTYALSAGYRDAYYGKAQQVRARMAEEFAAVYQDFDVLLTPTAPSTAFSFGAKADPMAMYLNDVYTIPSNLVGHPAMSVPFGIGDDGMPIGVQVLAPLMGEVVMFQVAAELERAAGGAS
jgi:aspartyl-tRNA(Asn)/glutamyl-tRNA(Gln) amidotransferase subunit A